MDIASAGCGLSSRKMSLPSALQLADRLDKEHRLTQVADPIGCVTFAPVEQSRRSGRRHHRNRGLARIDVAEHFEQLVAQRVHVRAVRRIVDLHELKEDLLALRRLADLAECLRLT